MDTLKKKYTHIIDAVNSFEKALADYDNWAKNISPKAVEVIGIDYDDTLISLRDSAIQRFEYSIDLLWKYIKTYLEYKLQVVPELLNPTNIIREASKIPLITEEESISLIEMIKHRNLTSHIYQQEFAELLHAKLPIYFATMHTVLPKVKV